jgi:hypothetical protein
MLQEIDGVRESQLQVGRGVGHRRREALAQRELAALGQQTTDPELANNAKKILPEVDKLAKVITFGADLSTK